MLKHASVFITLIVAILYTLGLNYYQGFLGEFGLQESMFPLTFDQTTFTGFLSFVDIGFKPILWIVVATEVAVVFAYLVEFLLIRLQKVKASDLPTTTESPSRTKLVPDAERLFTYAIVIFLAFVGSVLISFASTKAGKAAANNYNEKIKRGVFDSKSIVFKDGGEVFKGYYIMSSPQQYALMIDGKPTVYNMADIKMIVSNQDKNESKNLDVNWVK